MKKSDCSAKRDLEGLRAARRSCRSSSPLASAYPQNIGGVIIPPPDSRETFQHRPLILQKSDICPPDAPCGSLSPLVEQADQAVGQSTTNTSAAYRTGQKATRNMADTESGHKMKFSQSGLLYTLHMIREPVVDYQETRGVPRNEEITFLTLVTSLCTQAYTAAITILVMLWNLMPLVDGFVYFVRFMLDKTIDIVQTEDNKDRAVKAVILIGELTIIAFILFMIIGLIFMPVYVLMARLFSKIFSMIAW